MGVYIRGMEMPTSCLNCFLSRSGCHAVLKRMRAMETGTWIPANYRHDDCPLVPVPKHGRLGDLDTLYTELAKRKSYGELSAKSALRAVANAPTVIPAEEGET